ncbi:MAG: DNA mismatch repair endonuclease MutL [Bacteroidia bacterium]|nr:DNA mismatch repair endonuclease MutL [Bacteroidia bacterium]MDW8014819.1 DNA mismatch repair endonuclease MutL [Bacteroidia bacterium]
MIIDAPEQRIRVLPEAVINQIAAGEVILRPASVIKELVENAIDAQAFTISVWTERGGKQRIQVTDDGMGMSPIDAELCFERYATSKIQSIKDLQRLLTKGFRGEALASIAAVAEVELFTRQPSRPIGTYVRIAFGKKLQVEPTRCAAGTTFIVQKLFHRLPVRRKSLHSDQTEHRYNLQEFFRIAYPHPERHFRFYHNSTLLYDLPPSTLLHRILSIHTDLKEEDLIPVEENTSFFSIQGFLLSPEATPPHNRDSFLFINRRFIRHAALQQAAYSVYKPFLKGEARPLYWLFLEVPPSQIDINVTPAKTEARLLNEMEIRALLQSIIRRALALAPLALPQDWLQKVSSSLPPLPAQQKESQLEPFAPSLASVPLSGASSEYFLLYGRYLLLRRGKEIWLIDLLGAYQRILFEKWLNGASISPQGLLFPVHMPITPLQAAKLRELALSLLNQGLQIEVREEKEVVLHTVPAGLPFTAAAAILEEIIALTNEEEEKINWRERLAQHIARYNVIRPPYTLTSEGVEALWHDLNQCSQPNQSPSGRPIRFLLTEAMLENLFR